MLFRMKKLYIYAAMPYIQPYSTIEICPAYSDTSLFKSFQSLRVRVPIEIVAAGLYNCNGR